MTVCGGNFTAPAEGPVAFRRDRVPLDVDAMAGLSRQLVTLAQGLDGQTAAARRAAAQMLALAIALDPGNARARDVIADFQKEQSPEAVDPSQLEKSRKRVWQILAWLETAEAGSQGQALAACLSDILVLADPQNPLAEITRTSGERGSWHGWIPALAAFESVKLPEPAADPQPAETAEADSPAVALPKAQVFTVIWKRTGKTEPAPWVQGSAPLLMVAEKLASPDEHPRPFSIEIAPQAGGRSFRNVSVTLTKLLKNRLGTLPAGVRISINCPDLTASPDLQKTQSISAAAAVLASAAMSGIEPDATIIGVVDEAGAFQLPTGFWSQLQSLGSGNGGRLILPAAAAEYLPSMLALEKPQLFLDYEVLLAGNFQELVKLSAKSPEESLAKSLANFREIREKAGSQPLGQYAANSFVRKRLVEIVQEAPNHFSAKMLAIQGAGDRPTYIPRMVLAAELRRAIEPMEWLVQPGGLDLELPEVAKLGLTSEVCRTQVDRLARYAEKNDKPLLDRVQAMVIGIRTLDRAARSRGDNYEVQGSILSSYAALRRVYQTVAGELASELGEPPPVPEP